MKSQLDKKLKTALDESRLLILGAQVLFGFTFQGVFQDLFVELPQNGQLVQCTALAMMLVSIGCLIAPSLHHQIVSSGDSRKSSLKAATAFANLSLLPIALGLGASVFVVFERMFGMVIAGTSAGTITLVALFLLYGLGFALRRRENEMPAETLPTPIRVKIEQLLTEARVLIPGGQALLGFQFVATLTRAFSELPSTIQYVHACGLIAVALAVILLMTPAALHRLAYGGDDDLQFFRIGSRILIAAALPLALGISADVIVVFSKVFESAEVGAAAGITSFSILMGLWYIFPLSCRSSFDDRSRSIGR